MLRRLLDLDHTIIVLVQSIGKRVFNFVAENITFSESQNLNPQLLSIQVVILIFCVVTVL